MSVELCVIMLLVAVKFVSAILLPTAPENVRVPVPPAIIKAWEPSRVLSKVILVLVDVIVLAPMRLTGDEKVKALVTVMFAPT